MRNVVIAILIILVLYKSVPLGVAVLIYIIQTNESIRKLERQYLIMVKEFIKKGKEEKERVPSTARMPDRIIPYQGCIIEDYEDFYQIVMPSGKKLEKRFNSFDEAKEEIKTVLPFLKKEKK